MTDNLGLVGLILRAREKKASGQYAHSNENMQALDSHLRLKLLELLSLLLIDEFVLLGLLFATVYVAHQIRYE